MAKVQKPRTCILAHKRGADDPKPAHWFLSKARLSTTKHDQLVQTLIDKYGKLFEIEVIPEETYKARYNVQALELGFWISVFDRKGQQILIGHVSTINAMMRDMEFFREYGVRFDGQDPQRLRL